MHDYEEIIYCKTNNSEIIENLEKTLQESNKALKERNMMVEMKEQEVKILKIKLISKVSELQKSFVECQRDNGNFQEKVHLYLNEIKKNITSYESKIENLESEVI